MMPLFILIVIYNKDCSDFLPLFRRLMTEDCNVIVYDNSTSVGNNAVVCQENGVVYLGGKGNMGLSKAYNSAAEYCLNQSKRGFLCLFDDDTDIPNSYITEVRKHIGEEKTVLLPMLYCGEQLISPAILKPNFHCEFFADLDAIKGYQGSALTALNSGMAISLSIFSDYHYDERLFLDGIDHRFVSDMKKAGISFYFLDCCLKHELSALEKPSFESALHRFRIFKNDVSVFAGNRWRRVLLRRGLKLTLQYRTTAFLKELCERQEDGKK